MTNPQWKVEVARDLKTYQQMVHDIQERGGEIRLLQFINGEWAITYVVSEVPKDGTLSK